MPTGGAEGIAAWPRPDRQPVYGCNGLAEIDTLKSYTDLPRPNGLAETQPACCRRQNAGWMSTLGVGADLAHGLLACLEAGDSGVTTRFIQNCTLGRKLNKIRCFHKRSFAHGAAE